MRILQVHNFYRSRLPSGENTVVVAEAALLRAAGHDVLQFERSNDEVGQFPWSAGPEGLALAAWNPFSVRAFERAVKRFQPDVIHVHNTFPLLSPAVLRAASHSKAAVVWTVHNFRPWCVVSTLLRDGQFCDECVQAKSPMPGIRHRCKSYHSGLTWPSNLAIALHQQLQTWTTAADRVIAMSNFQAGVLESAGIPRERLCVKPHFIVEAESLRPRAWSSRPNQLLFIGRLSIEKGTDLLIEALARWLAQADADTDIPELHIVGEGTEMQRLRRLAARLSVQAYVHFHGQLSAAEVQRRLAESRLLVVPSRWYETFGLITIEAAAHEVPALVADLGGLPELIEKEQTGAVFAADNADALAASLQQLWSEPKRLQRMGQAARARVLSHYSGVADLPRLEAVYRDAIVAKSARREAVL